MIRVYKKHKSNKDCKNEIISSTSYLHHWYFITTAKVLELDPDGPDVFHERGYLRLRSIGCVNSAYVLVRGEV